MVTSEALAEGQSMLGQSMFELKLKDYFTGMIC